jgi:hypothetical protein
VTQFPQDAYYDPTMPASEPPRRSGLAVTALVMSLIGLVPCLGLITAPVGILLGLIGLVAIRPPRTGKGMAAAAVLIGVVLTAAQAYFGKKYVVDPIYGVVSFVMSGPNDALEAGSRGDIATFKASFDGAGATASDAEARAFLDELARRYGAFVSANIPQQQQGNVTRPQPGQRSMPMPYQLRFANSTVNSDVELVFTDAQDQGLIMKLGRITVFDAQLGDLTFPASAASAAPLPPATQPGDSASQPPATQPGG